MRQIRGHRWLALDRESLRLKINARALGDGSFHATISADDVTFAEADVIMADHYPPPLAAMSHTLSEGRQSAWTPKRLYTELMFHGRRLQAVSSMDRTGSNGAEATLCAVDTSDFLRCNARPEFLASPVLLDAAGQVVGFWIAETADRAFHVFPFRCEEVQFFAPDLPAGTRVQCRTRTEYPGPLELRSDIDLIGPGGTLFARLAGWEDKRFDLPDPFFRLRLAPRSTMMSHEVEVDGLTGPATRVCVLDEIPRDLLQLHGGIWQQVLVGLILSRSEREYFQSLTLPEPRRIEWLLGRAAAKDAVRRALGVELLPADVEIAVDEIAEPAVHCGTEKPLRISISCRAGVAAAIATTEDVATDFHVQLLSPDDAIASNTGLLSSTSRRQWVVRDGKLTIAISSTQRKAAHASSSYAGIR